MKYISCLRWLFPKKKKLLLTFGIGVSFVYFVLQTFITSKDYKYLQSKNVILIWGSHLYGMPLSSYTGDQELKQCLKLNCTVVADKSAIDISKAIVVSWDSINYDDKPPPITNDQIVFFHTLESPSTDLRLMEATELRYKMYKNVFNSLISYRTDSDIYTPYYKYSVTPSGKRNILKNVKPKTKMAAWFVSNLKSASSQRDVIVKDLIKFGVDVDIYGKGNLDCPKSENDQCLQMLENTYKFYFAFENSICKDYVTEKYFKVLTLNIVPVVFGGADYKSFAPKHSYIDVTEFNSTENLAKYLKKLDADDQLYFKYLEWKVNSEVKVWLGNRDYFCRICESIVNPKRMKRYENLKEVWYDDQCLYDDRKFNRSAIDQHFGFNSDSVQYIPV